MFELGGITYPNNTIVLLEDIGEGDNALLCVSNNTDCCGDSSSFRGEFLYPNGTVVPVHSADHSSYRNRGPGFVRLNQRANAVNPQLGRYHCEILDDTDSVQLLFINIGECADFTKSLFSLLNTFPLPYSVQNTSTCFTAVTTPTPVVTTCPTPTMTCDDCPTTTQPSCPPVTPCPIPQGIITRN